MAGNPPGDREIHLGLRWTCRDIPSRYASNESALAEKHFPAAQIPSERSGPPSFLTIEVYLQKPWILELKQPLPMVPILRAINELRKGKFAHRLWGGAAA